MSEIFIHEIIVENNKCVWKVPSVCEYTKYVRACVWETTWMSSGMGEQKLLFSFFAALKMVSGGVLFFLVCVRLNLGPILTAGSPVQPVFDEKV